MKRNPAHFAKAFSLFAVLLLIMLSSVSAQQPRQGTIAVAPTNITRPESVTHTVTSASGIDLSNRHEPSNNPTR